MLARVYFLHDEIYITVDIAGASCKRIEEEEEEEEAQCSANRILTLPSLS
jgi:hypothetical protein